MEILLKDILKFDEIREKMKNNNAIRVRFNNEWSESDGKYFIYVEKYLSNNENDKKELENNLLTYKKEKGQRMYDNEIVFQFIRIENDKWILVDVIYVEKTKGSKIDNKAEVKHLKEYEKFIDRLIVNKSKKAIRKAWTTNNVSIVDDTKVVEILPRSYKEMYSEFRGYENVSKSYHDLKNVIDAPIWKQALKNVYGVYLITDKHTGKLYVGSATGNNGIYGRWKTYLTAGYDEEEEENKNYPNKGLKKIVENEGLEYIQNYFQYSIIEIFTKNKLGANKALEREKYWKLLLDSHSPHGYNYN